eukprot:Hpha_TRINITY_DN19864_c0_g1::TRINITY_DN19864_c0_g1_i1::g.132101::m.132101
MAHEEIGRRTTYSSADVENLQQSFDRLCNKDKVMGEAEFAAAFGPAGERLHSLFAGRERGPVNFTTYALGVAGAQGKRTPPTNNFEAEELFVMLDADRDGSVGLADLKTGLSAFLASGGMELDAALLEKLCARTLEARAATEGGVTLPQYTAQFAGPPAK